MGESSTLRQSVLPSSPSVLPRTPQSTTAFPLSPYLERLSSPSGGASDFIRRVQQSGRSNRDTASIPPPTIPRRSLIPVRAQQDTTSSRSQGSSSNQRSQYNPFSTKNTTESRAQEGYGRSTIACEDTFDENNRTRRSGSQEGLQKPQESSSVSPLERYLASSEIDFGSLLSRRSSSVSADSSLSFNPTQNPMSATSPPGARLGKQRLDEGTQSQLRTHFSHLRPRPHSLTPFPSAPSSSAESEGAIPPDQSPPVGPS